MSDKLREAIAKREAKTASRKAAARPTRKPAAKKADPELAIAAPEAEAESPA